MTPKQQKRLDWFDILPDDAIENEDMIIFMISDRLSINIYPDGSWEMLGKGSKGGSGSPTKFQGYPPTNYAIENS